MQPLCVNYCGYCMFNELVFSTEASNSMTCSKDAKTGDMDLFDSTNK